MSVKDLLSEASLLGFCARVLRIENPVAMSRSDPVALLHRLVRAYHEHCPFNNVSDVVEQASDSQQNKLQIRVAPQLASVIRGEGGTCAYLSITLYKLLTHLGFHSYVAIAITRNKPGMEMLHFVVLVRDVQHHGDLWFLDPGTRIAPLFQAVPLSDVRKRSELDVGRSSFVHNKFTWEGDFFRRYYKPINADLFSLFYELYLDDNTIINEDDGIIDYEKFSQSIVAAYSESMRKRQTSSKTAVDRVDKFWSQNFLCSGYPEGRGVLFVNDRMQIEDDSGRLVTTTLRSKEELKDQVTKYYPNLKTEKLNWFIDHFWNAKYNSKL